MFSHAALPEHSHAPLRGARSRERPRCKIGADATKVCERSSKPAFQAGQMPREVDSSARPRYSQREIDKNSEEMNMINRNFGTRCGLQVAPLSIGGMRFPGDVVDAVALIRHAIDSGMRYIDTCRAYGESEFILSRALKDGYREKVFLSTKCSPWIRKIKDSDDGSADSVRRRIEEQMLRLDVDYLDFYQVWNVNNPEAWEIATRKGGMVDGIRKAMDEGIVKHTGFTTHEAPEKLVKYLDEADWCEILLVSYNMMKLDYAPALEAARKHAIGTIVMNPCGGGTLAESSPVLGDLAKEVGAASVADMAVRFVLSNPNVDTMLCGMSKPQDVDDSIASVGRGPFSEEQVARITAFFAQHSSKNVGFCTACKYCMPCPSGINIPAIMGAVYQDRFLGLKAGARQAYRWAGKVKADACVKCGECETKCTQQLKIMSDMGYAAAEYGSD